MLLRLASNPLARYSAAAPWMRPLALGVLIGFFTVGRPYGLFQKAFAHFSTVGNPLLGGVAIALQGLGNIFFVVVLVLGLMYGTGGRFERWMQRHPHVLHVIAAASMIAGGTFFIVYWGIRVPSYFDIGWFPHMPYR